MAGRKKALEMNRFDQKEEFMGKHLLLEKAVVYPLPKSNPKMEGYFFDDLKGYWVNKQTGAPMMLDENCQRPQSKKNDIETGEDRKGE